MQITGSVDILVDKEGAYIVVKDDDANARILEFHLTPSQFLAAMRGLVGQSVDMRVFDLSNIGKRHECAEFEIDDQKAVQAGSYEDELWEEAERKRPEGWITDKYLHFFYKNGKRWCRVTIRRWVDRG